MRGEEEKKEYEGLKAKLDGEGTMSEEEKQAIDREKETLEKRRKEISVRMNQIGKEVELEEKEAYFSEHILPALQWLTAQDKSKPFVIKIQNIPRNVQDSNLKNYLKRWTIDVDECKISINRNERGKSTGTAWFQSKNQRSLQIVLRLHNKVTLNSVF